MAKTEPMDKLRQVSGDLVKSLGERAIGTAGDKLNGLTDKLDDIAGGGPIGKAVKKGGEAAAEGKSPVGGAIKGALSGVKDKITGGGSSPKATKAMNIIEEIDVGVPVSVAYNQWTEFGEFPSFMKKVEKAEAEDENKITFKAQIFLSHREWEATILEQSPDERIVWRSKGQKGHVDGAVTFHEIGPNLTRILVVLEYYPQGLFERTGNLWRAQGRRARLELKHFRRHVMTRTILNPDEVEGWRGIIQDGEVVKSHDEVVEEEERERQESEEQDDYDESEDSGDEDVDEDAGSEDDEADAADEPDDEYAEDEAGDEADDEYAEEEPGDEAEEEPGDEDEYEEESEGDEEDAPEEDDADEDADEYEEDEEQEDERPRRRRAS